MAVRKRSTKRGKVDGKADGKRKERAKGRGILAKVKSSQLPEIKIVSMEEAPRRKGTKGFVLYNQAKRWVKRKRNGTVDQLIAETDYAKKDFDWDLAKGHIKIKRLSA